MSKKVRGRGWRGVRNRRRGDPNDEPGCAWEGPFSICQSSLQICFSCRDCSQHGSDGADRVVRTYQEFWMVVWIALWWAIGGGLCAKEEKDEGRGFRFSCRRFRERRSMRRGQSRRKCASAGLSFTVDLVARNPPALAGGRTVQRCLALTQRRLLAGCLLTLPISGVNRRKRRPHAKGIASRLPRVAPMAGEWSIGRG